MAVISTWRIVKLRQFSLPRLLRNMASASSWLYFSLLIFSSKIGSPFRLLFRSLIYSMGTLINSAKIGCRTSCTARYGVTCSLCYSSLSVKTSSSAHPWIWFKRVPRLCWNFGCLNAWTRAISVFRLLGYSGISSFSFRNISSKSANDLAGSFAGGRDEGIFAKGGRFCRTGNFYRVVKPANFISVGSED